jgi:hypothetical protein
MPILVYRNDQQEGPYEIEQIEKALQEGQLAATDLAWQEGLADWVPLGDIVTTEEAVAPAAVAAAKSAANGISRAIDQRVEKLDSALGAFLGDEQDPAAVAKMVTKAKDLLTSGEQIEYIAVQKKPLVNIAPDGLLLTNKRLMIVRPKLLGMTFQDYIWRDIGNVHMSEQMLTATITCTVTGGVPLKIDSIPKKQARKIYGIAQEKEERVREERRMRDMEEKRAAAGGITIAAPGQGPASVAPAADDPMAVLGKLKNMVDAGLIQPQEYEAKKAEVLARM